MFTILIVDDEKLICQGIKATIKRCNIDKIGEIMISYNGKEALEIVEKKKPDIIITDINMPEISGIELIKSIKKDFLNTEFIVLSGYDEFNYVRESFRLGVCDYLLKPINSNKLKELLLQIIEKIEGNKELEKLREVNKKKYNKILLEKNIINLFKNYKTNSKDKKEELLETFKEIFCYQHYSLVLLEVEKDKYTNIQESYQCLIEKINEFYVEELYYYDNQICLILNFKELEIYGKVCKCLQEYIASYSILKKAYISEVFKNISRIFEIHEQAKKLLKYSLVYRANIINKDLIENNINSKSNIPSLLINKLDRNLQLLNLDKISNILDDIFNEERMKTYELSLIYKLYRKILLIIDENFQDDVTTYREFYDFASTCEIKLYLKELIYQKRAKKLKEDNKIISLVKEYVKKNKGNVDMKVVADNFYLSYSYFSKLFKDEVGINFQDYIMKVKMEKAVEMLERAEYKIYHIASEVGYDNPTHFSRAFKRYYGLSPSKYRNNHCLK